MVSPPLVPGVYPSPPAHQDPDFMRAAAWLSSNEGPAPVVGVVGVPFSELSISGARCDLLPSALRAALWSFSTFLPERGVDLGDFTSTDHGDIALAGLFVTESMERIQGVIADLAPGRPLAVIGGDNSITAPAMLGAVGPAGGLITIDAHHDLRDYERDGLSNGSPVRVLLDAGVSGDCIVQIGIRDLANSRPYAEFAEKMGISVMRVPEVRTRGMLSCIEQALSTLQTTDGIYVDVDLDVVERALAPGAPAAQPGGLLPSDLADAAFICGSNPKVVALDIVEVDPERDVADSTVRLAALVLLSFLAGVASR